MLSLVDEEAISSTIVEFTKLNLYCQLEAAIYVRNQCCPSLRCAETGVHGVRFATLHAPMPALR